MSDYAPQPVPQMGLDALERYLADELNRIRLSMGGGGMSLLDYHGITSGNSTTLNKFGRAPDMDSGNWTDVWDKNTNVGGKIALWNQPTAARQMRLTSTSTNDWASGTGARTVRIYGLKDWSTAETFEDLQIPSAGGNVTSVDSYVIIHRMVVTESGGGFTTAAGNGSNDGILSLTALVDGFVTAAIAANWGQTLMAIWGVPSGQTAYISRWYMHADGDARSTSMQIRLVVSTDPENDRNNWNTKHVTGMVTEGTSAFDQEFQPYLVIPGPAILKVQAIPEGSTNNMIVTAGFDGFVKG